MLLSCLVAYVLLHGVGKGLLPMVFERQMLAQLRLLDGNTAVLRRSVANARLPLISSDCLCDSNTAVLRFPPSPSATV